MNDNKKSDSVLKVFDNMATEYVEYFGEDWEFINEIKEFASQFKENSTILDLGCGSGYITDYLCSLNLNAIGIDFSEEMINIAKEKYPKLNFLLANFINIDDYFKENSVDGLIAIYSLYFIPREQFENVLSSLSKILKDGGKLLFVTQIGNGEKFVTTPLMDKNNIKGKIYVNYYIKEELEHILNKNNFSIEYFTSKYDCDENEISNDGRYIVLVKNRKN